ncbi:MULTISPECIES: hypothetical protein [Pandoraea]|jgi:hypothetical protein|uniref:Uncharacterized protein n=2 Tax=Pandoraea TaxID=93217 RepID=A0A378YXE6_9BURK|nr:MULTISPECIES: hypothetical protein [Pandoraea]AHB77450.1 hypothetical protein X636_19860 [Pandoraea pnomenusa]AHN74211.1 hypothetical protein DA70_06815 [Pandoraea pnomenusa]AIU29212.1 hypothetical protein LV28_23870 [Pandoraea pnomenusa]ANC46178.1 hypothetical protein A6P55_20350 [Pandoraea pnomenusa]MBN9092899.1 hypothetical protein [Pandoraea pnomenusa]
MKKLCLTALVALCSTALVPAAFAADTPAPKHKTTKKAAPKKKAPAKKATVAAAPAQPDEGSELWSCKDNERLFLKGDMKRDQILTLFWSGRNYKLPRQQTTTGADRFYDAASGLDLVVIPAKAMLFTHRDGGARLADECMTHAMAEQNKLAPTQSNELIKVAN